LNSSLHRSIESQTTIDDLRMTLPPSFQILHPLAGGTAMRDEGAANHMRLASPAGPGIHVWVYGDGEPRPKRFWPRQSLSACQSIARRHGLDASRVVYLKQHPQAIDAGAFHNDVVAMSDHDLLIHHELAYDTNSDSLQQVEDRFQQCTGRSLNRIVVPQSQFSIEDAIGTYLFNSQIISRDHGDELERILLCPRQVELHGPALQLVRQWQQSRLFSKVHYVDLDQSMDAGGGPACLRLRVPVQAQELELWSPHRRWSESIDAELREAIRTTYPTRLTLQDLGREEFVQQAVQGANRISQILAVR
jgi:succinylarginine dihydrolase